MIDRRTTKRLLMAMSLGLLAILVLATPALAGRRWCAKDPIVELNGTRVQFWVSIPEEYVPYVNGPIVTKVQTAHGVEQKLIFTDDGFNGYGERVKWAYLYSGDCRISCTPIQVREEGTFKVQIAATVPVDKKLLYKKLKISDIPLRLTIVRPDGTKRMIIMTNDGAKIAFWVQGVK